MIVRIATRRGRGVAAEASWDSVAMSAPRGLPSDHDTLAYDEVSTEVSTVHLSVRCVANATTLTIIPRLDGPANRAWPPSDAPITPTCTVI